MYSRQHKNAKNSANSSDKAFTSQFAPRGFVVQPKTEAATPQQEQTPDLESQGEEAKQYKSAFIDASKFTPRSSPAVTPRVQMKLTIGQPGDKYEQEADRMAADVVQRINAPQSESVQRVELPENEDDELQMKPLSSNIQRVELPENEDDELQMKPMVQRFSVEGGTTATPDIEESIQRAKGGGQPLGESIREPMEQAFGADFSGVKVHTDSQSDQLNQSIQAKAFTTGQDVFFRGGEYNPGSRQGQELIAHELTHTIQQGSASINPQVQTSQVREEGSSSKPREGQVKTAHTLTRPILQNGGGQHTIQRQALNADEILKGIPAVLQGNQLLPDKTELDLDTVIFGDQTLTAHIGEIIGNYESQFEKGTEDAVIKNAMKILAALSAIGKLIARQLHMAQEHPTITRALLQSQEARLINTLKAGSKTEESSDKDSMSPDDAKATIDMVNVLSGDDPVGMYVQEKTSLRKAEASIRQMAKKLNKTPIEVFELLRQQYESRMGAFSLNNVQANEVSAPDGYMFPLKDLYGEISVNFFNNLLDLKNGEVQWGAEGLVYKSAEERQPWKGGSGSGEHKFQVNDLKALEDAVSSEPDEEEEFTITPEEQEEKGWERLNERQMEYLTSLDEAVSGKEETSLIQHFTKDGMTQEEAEKKIAAGVNHLNTKPVTITTKAQDMVKPSGEMVDIYKPFFAVFMQEQDLSSELPNLGVEATINVIEDVLGRGLDYGQYRLEKDESQIGDSPLQLKDLPVMSCVNFAFENNKSPNYYGDTHFELKPEVRKRAAFAYGTGSPERRSMILLLHDVFQRDPKKFEQICDGTYSLYDLEVHIYGNVNLRNDVQNFHLGNPNKLTDADTRGMGKPVPQTGGSPTDQLRTLKGVLDENDVDQLVNIWVNKQKGTEKLKELIRTLNLDEEVVNSNIDGLAATQEIDKDALNAPPEKEALLTVPKSTKTVAKPKQTRKKGLCYITTACVTAKGLPDDCDELQTLRQFRDDYMLSLPTGFALIEVYYEQSPKIVEAIEKSQDSESIYENLYKVILTCVDAIKQKEYQMALKIYIDMVIKLRDKFAPELDVPKQLLGVLA